MEKTTRLACLLWLLSAAQFLFFSPVTSSSSSSDQTETNEIKTNQPELLLLTVATNETDGFKRYLRSAKLHNLNGKVLGMGEVWKGGDDIANKPGGGHKINLLKDELKEHKDRDDLVIMFTDSYDVVLLADQETIMDQFLKMNAKVVFGAEGFCWPDQSLQDKYPLVESGKRFLNSGGFIGWANDVFSIVSHTKVEDTDDDQMYYTNRYLDEPFRTKHNIKLDHKANIFQNLNGAVPDVELRFDGNLPYLINSMYETKPLVLHGNGPSKNVLNSLGNYLPKAWNKEDQCTSCWEDTLVFDDLPEVPHVMLAIFIEKPIPFIEEFFDKIDFLDYPKDKMSLFIHYTNKYHEDDVEGFLKKDRPDKYLSVKLVKPEDNVKEWHARNKGLDECRAIKCDYYFSVDGDAHIDNPHTLKLLIEQNRNVVAPFLIRPYKAWSNFWGALTSEGFYARSMDYMEIVQSNRRGLWNVPYISSAYLIKGSLVQAEEGVRPSFIHRLLDADMGFCANLRDAGIFFYVSNRVDWGHLVNADEFSIEHINNELWELANNRWDWEIRYLHPDFHKSLEENATLAQPCPDVYWFPVVTERFADELVAEMENFGKWSDGNNNDSRIEGGYESVPTRDIHLKQVDLEDVWLEFLEAYVMPLQEAVFVGYAHDPPRAMMNFVVRYRPDEQPSLRPHHDSSTYTINVALNHAGIDYEGGGCRFIRYDCTVKDTKKGWMLMHPGRLTHYHEGLTVTRGTRYIMISFVDP